MKLLKFYIVGFLLFTTQIIFAQMEFTATVSKNKLGVNQRFKVQFSVNKQGADDFTPPSFKDFKVIAGPSSSINQSWINGKATYTHSYIYFLQPKRKGDLVIGAAKIEYDGKIYSTKPVKVTVTEKVEIPKDPNNPMYVAQQNVHLVAEVSNTKPYVGEGIYVEYKLYVSENVTVNDWRSTAVPEYNGFWNQNIEVKDINVRRGKYNGEDYRYIILERAVLIPQRDGKLKVEPMEMDISVGVPTGRGDFFGNMITRNISYSASSTEKTIAVKALPENGKPADFTGAVGEFDFTVTSDKKVLKANDAAQVTVAVTGRGNFKLFDIPKIITPPELEVYTPEHQEDVKTALNGLRGTIKDVYTVVPQYKGKYKIPEVSFSYFSPKKKKYITKTIDPIIVDVAEGKELPGADEAATVAKRAVVSTDNNFRFIALNTQLKPSKKVHFFKSSEYYWLLIVPFLIIPVALFVGKKRAERAGDVFGNRIRKADKLARKYLSEAKKQLGKKEAFYIALEKALHNFLKAKLFVETSDISQEKIAEILKEKGIDQETIDEFIEVLNDCDFARYTPTTDVMMQQEFEKAKMVITDIDKQL